MSFLENTAFVAMDLETTGLRPPYAKIVEIGAVRFVGNQVVDQFQSLVNPGCSIPADVIRIHGITNSMVQDQGSIKDVLPLFLEFAGDCPLVIHNASFDMRFLSIDIPRYGSKSWSAHVVDTLRLARLSFPQLGRHSLESLVQSLRIPGNAAHRALADSLCAMHIFRKCVEKQSNGCKMDAQVFLSSHATRRSCAGAAPAVDKWPPGFELLKRAMEEGETVSITYRDSYGKTTKRSITPRAMTSNQSTLIIEAFCHLRQDTREFRLDRIVGIETD